jgi:hypothetical protein
MVRTHRVIVPSPKVMADSGIGPPGWRIGVSLSLQYERWCLLATIRPRTSSSALSLRSGAGRTGRAFVGRVRAVWHRAVRGRGARPADPTLRERTRRGVTYRRLRDERLVSVHEVTGRAVAPHVVSIGAPGWTRSARRSMRGKPDSMTSRLASPRKRRDSAIGGPHSLLRRPYSLLARLDAPLGRRHSLLGRHCSPLGRHYSLLGRHYSLLGRHCSLLGRHCSLLGRHCSLLGRHCSLLGRHCSPLGRHCSPLGRHCSPLGRHCSPLGRHCSLLGRPCSLLGRLNALLRRPYSLSLDDAAPRASVRQRPGVARGGTGAARSGDRPVISRAPRSYVK